MHAPFRQLETFAQVWPELDVLVVPELPPDEEPEVPPEELVVLPSPVLSLLQPAAPTAREPRARARTDECRLVIGNFPKGK